MRDAVAEKSALSQTGYLSVRNAQPTTIIKTMQELLQPYLVRPIAPDIYEKLETYLELLLRWNARTNLTAIRDRSGIIQRHFGESLLIGQLLPPFRTLLDFGSGAGFPGIPIQLLYSEAKVTLAESQGKKASFLREVVRTLALPSDVWAQRVESMPERMFDVVTLRAVDHMEQAIQAALPRVADKGVLALFSGEILSGLPQNFHWSAHPVPNSSGLIHIGRKSA